MAVVIDVLVHTSGVTSVWQASQGRTCNSAVYVSCFTELLHSFIHSFTIFTIYFADIVVACAFSTHMSKKSNYVPVAGIAGSPFIRSYSTVGSQ